MSLLPAIPDPRGIFANYHDCAENLAARLAADKQDEAAAEQLNRMGWQAIVLGEQCLTLAGTAHP